MRRLFGAKSEKIDEAQLRLMLEEGAPPDPSGKAPASSGVDAPEEVVCAGDKSRPKRKRGGHRSRIAGLDPLDVELREEVPAFVSADPDAFEHPSWRDTLKLFPGGAFTRTSTPCIGRWEAGDGGVIRLRWFDWPEETLVPIQPPHEGTGRYRCSPTTVDTIVVELWGGLGNQMFQYAHGLALARKLGSALKLSFSDYGRPFGLHHFGLALDPDCPSECELVEDMEGHDDRREWPSLTAAKRTTSRSLRVWGYFQNREYFRPVEDELRGIFQVEPSIPDEARGGTPVCVHVRRGDFVQSGLHNLCQPGYYRASIRMIRALVDSPRFLVLSDDPGWCRDQFAGEPDLVVLDCPDEKKALAVMAGCKAFVLSNSTFGWWGAWMAGADPVIAPRRYLSAQTWRICPEEWILVPHDGVSHREGEPR